MPKRATSIVLGATGRARRAARCDEIHRCDHADSQAFGTNRTRPLLAIAADCVACQPFSTVGKPFAGGGPIETPFGTSSRRTLHRIATPASERGPMSNSTMPSAGEFVQTARDLSCHAIHGLHQDVARGRTGNPRLPQDRCTSTEPGGHEHLALSRSISAPRCGSGMHSISRKENSSPIRRSRPNGIGSFPRARTRSLCCLPHAKVVPGRDKTSEYLRGSYLQGWFAPNITNDPRTGLGDWSASDVATI